MDFLCALALSAAEVSSVLRELDGSDHPGHGESMTTPRCSYTNPFEREAFSRRLSSKRRKAAFG